MSHIPQKFITIEKIYNLWKSGNYAKAQKDYPKFIEEHPRLISAILNKEYNWEKNKNKLLYFTIQSEGIKTKEDLEKKSEKIGEELAAEYIYPTIDTSKENITFSKDRPWDLK